MICTRASFFAFCASDVVSLACIEISAQLMQVDQEPFTRSQNSDRVDGSLQNSDRVPLSLQNINHSIYLYCHTTMLGTCVCELRSRPSLTDHEPIGRRVVELRRGQRVNVSEFPPESTMGFSASPIAHCN